MKRLSISRFMNILIIVLCVILTATTTIMFAVVYRNSLYQTAIVNSEQSISQVSNTIEIYAREMKEDLKMIDREVQRFGSEDELQEYMNNLVQIRNRCVSVMIYDTDGNMLLCSNNDNEIKQVSESNTSFLPELFADGDYDISAPHVQNIFKGYYPWVTTVGCKVYLEQFGREVYLAMDVEALSIVSYVDNVSIGQRGYCFVIDKYGNMVYHPQQQLIYLGVKDEDTRAVLEQDNNNVTNGVIYSKESLNDGHWIVVGVSYTDELVTEKLQELWWLIFVNLIVCVIISYLTIRAFNRSVSRPIRGLAKEMIAFEENAGDYKYETKKGVYEMQMLSESFGHMVRKIQQLMENAKKEEILLRKTELKALQSQINPHFLYNTLDSIQWMCERKETERSVKMVGALAKLFRISISKGKELITIADEIEHAKNYMVIQTFRYRNQFVYDFIIDDEVLPYFCNKITLQPIIENAIIHGIDPNFEDGQILILATVKGDNIVLTVSDNGIGMTSEQCESILKKDAKDDMGIGIKNVNDRIKIYFGEQYGIEIDSELDVGTTIRITFPKVTENIVNV
ncbi:MAG: sensor histidine kinase [Suipraeoptans sp.]